MSDIAHDSDKEQDQAQPGLYDLVGAGASYA